MITYIAVGIMIIMAVLEVILMNGIFICFAITALAVALLSVVHVPYAITGIVAAIVLALSLVFIRPMIMKYMSNKIEEMNKKYKELNESEKPDDEGSEIKEDENGN